MATILNGFSAITDFRRDAIASDLADVSGRVAVIEAVDVATSADLALVEAKADQNILDIATNAGDIATAQGDITALDGKTYAQDSEHYTALGELQTAVSQIYDRVDLTDASGNALTFVPSVLTAPVA